MKAFVKILAPHIYADAPLAPATAQSAGYDLRAAIDAPLVVRRGEPAVLVPTGLAIYSGSAQMAGLILPRSGLGHKKGLVLGNLVGLIDGDYQQQWYVSAWNRGQCDEIVIEPAERIAQAIFVPVIHPRFEVVDEFPEVTERALGGFGSTGAA